MCLWALVTVCCADAVTGTAWLLPSHLERSLHLDVTLPSNTIPGIKRKSKGIETFTWVNSLYWGPGRAYRIIPLKFNTGEVCGNTDLLPHSPNSHFIYIMKHLLSSSLIFKTGYRLEVLGKFKKIKMFRLHLNKLNHNLWVKPGHLRLKIFPGNFFIQDCKPLL